MQELISCIIVDDEQDAREGIELLLQSFLPDVEVLVKAENAEKAIREVINHKPDIIFLDVKMPGKDGFYVAEELEKLGIETTIIFITAYDQYAIDAIKHAAFDFILKPVDPDELFKAVTRFKNLKEKESLKTKLEKLNACLLPSHLKFSTLKGFIMIDPEEIIYCQSDGNYTDLFLTNGRRELITVQIGQIAPQLNEKLFVRISRTHIINIRFVKEFNKKKKVVELKGDRLTEFKVSQSGLKRLLVM